MKCIAQITSPRAVNEPKIATRMEITTRGGFQIIGTRIPSGLILQAVAAFLTWSAFPDIGSQRLAMTSEMNSSRQGEAKSPREVGISGTNPNMHTSGASFGTLAIKSHAPTNNELGELKRGRFRDSCIRPCGQDKILN